MPEKIDPYFAGRLEQGKAHRVIREIDIANLKQETEPNKTLSHPSIEGDISDFGWSEKSVDNIIDAARKGYIAIEQIGEDKIKINFLPLKNRPQFLGQVSELTALRQNLLRGGAIYGDISEDKFTYMQTVDFAVEGYMDDEEQGKKYARIFVNTNVLADYRNIYLDPESLHVTDYEYGYSFCVLGGIPFKAIDKIQIIKARKLPYKPMREEEGEWPTNQKEAEAIVAKQEGRFREFLKTLTNPAQNP